MKNIDLIYQSLDLIEKELKSDINVYSLSQEYGFSLYYFSRLFKGVTGYNPKTYMLNRKMSASITDLQQTDKKIIEIAFEYGFSTPESFSRAFHKVFGVNPSNLRKEARFDKQKLFRPVTKDSIEYNKRMISQEPELIEMDSLYLVGLPFYYEPEWKNDLLNPWENMIKNIDVIPEKLKPEKYFQLQYWFPDQDPGSIFFFLAVQVNNIIEIPVQFTAKIIPRQRYLKFLHKGLSNKVGNTYQYIYEKWLPETEYKLPHLYNFEYYGDQHKGPYNEESVSEIYIPVKL